MIFQSIDSVTESEILSELNVIEQDLLHEKEVSSDEIYRCFLQDQLLKIRSDNLLRDCLLHTSGKTGGSFVRSPSTSGRVL